jgi:hypothetical protein
MGLRGSARTVHWVVTTAVTAIATATGEMADLSDGKFMSWGKEGG